ncbi:IS3 family transposase [Pantoea sp. DY-15]|uniref:IS3 family transposase n=1 Tax=Pantoea sp. DY-15 TaxID=2871489 RepID=UPI001C95E60C|nr:IS3 family transposase [Pantoea sp. DY-15]
MVLGVQQLQKENAERDALRRITTELHQMSRCSAGARKLSSMLKQEGKIVGRYKAIKLMKEAALISR